MPVRGEISQVLMPAPWVKKACKFPGDQAMVELTPALCVELDATWLTQ